MLSCIKKTKTLINLSFHVINSFIFVKFKTHGE